MAADKVIDRVEKLLRLAAPTSGATEHERVSACLEAARLISENDLVVRRPRTRRATVEEEKPARDDESVGNVRYGVATVWVRTAVRHHLDCSYCNSKISPGDVVWMRMVNGQAECRHNYRPCNRYVAPGPAW